MAGSKTAQVNSISVVGITIPVWVLRIGSGFGFILSSLWLAMLGFEMLRDASRTEEGLFQLKYGGMIVNVHEQNLDPYSTIVDVDTIDDLARLADRHGGMILHMQRNFLHYYFVQSNGTMYRYVVTSGKKGVAAVEEPAVEQPTLVQSQVVEPEPVKKEERKRQVYEMLPRRVAAKRVSARRVEKAQEPVKQAPAREEAPNYILDTGEIEFYIPQQEETYVIERVRF